MKISTGTVLKTLKGENYKEGEDNLTLGRVIAEAFSSDQSGGKMKMFLLAEKAFKEKEIDVDAADLTLIKKAVEGCKSYNNLVTGQALVLLENVK